MDKIDTKIKNRIIFDKILIIILTIVNIFFISYIVRNINYLNKEKNSIFQEINNIRNEILKVKPVIAVEEYIEMQDVQYDFSKNKYKVTLNVKYNNLFAKTEEKITKIFDICENSKFNIIISDYENMYIPQLYEEGYKLEELNKDFLNSLIDINHTKELKYINKFSFIILGILIIKYIIYLHINILKEDVIYYSINFYKDCNDLKIYNDIDKMKKIGKYYITTLEIPDTEENIKKLYDIGKKYNSLNEIRNAKCYIMELSLFILFSLLIFGILQYFLNIYIGSFGKIKEERLKQEQEMLLKDDKNLIKLDYFMYDYDENKKFEIALKHYNQGNYFKAYQILSKHVRTKEGMDFKEKILKEYSYIDVINKKEREDFVLGEYEQDNNLENGKEPLVWKVIDKSHGNITLITKDVIDLKPFIYGEDKKNLNDWASKDFKEIAFKNCNIKKNIISTRLLNPDETKFLSYNSIKLSKYVENLAKEHTEYRYNCKDTFWVNPKDKEKLEEGYGYIFEKKLYLYDSNKVNAVRPVLIIYPNGEIDL